MDKILDIIKELLFKIPIWIDLAERIYSGAGQGKVKKTLVLELLDIFLTEIKFIEYKELVVEWADGFIDLVVKGFNLTGFWGKKVKIEIKEGEEL